MEPTLTRDLTPFTSQPPCLHCLEPHPASPFLPPPWDSCHPPLPSRWGMVLAVPTLGWHSSLILVPKVASFGGCPPPWLGGWPVGRGDGFLASGQSTTFSFCLEPRKLSSWPCVARAILGSPDPMRCSVLSPAGVGGSPGLLCIFSGQQRGMGTRRHPPGSRPPLGASAHLSAGAEGRFLGDLAHSLLFWAEQAQVSLGEQL